MQQHDFYILLQKYFAAIEPIRPVPITLRLNRLLNATILMVPI